MRLEKSEDAVPVALYIRTLAGRPGQLPASSADGPPAIRPPAPTGHSPGLLRHPGGPEPVRGDAGRGTGETPPFRQVLVHDEGRLCGRETGLQDLRARPEGNGVRVVPVNSPLE